MIVCCLFGRYESLNQKKNESEVYPYVIFEFIDYFTVRIP